MANETILVVDFGSQYTQRIVRRVREAGVFSVVHPYSKITPELIGDIQPKGIILSGGPASVNDVNAPRVGMWLLELGIPTLGICYGMQLLAQLFGGKVENSDNRQYGHATVEVRQASGIFGEMESWKLDHTEDVWMSHGDYVRKLPNGWRLLATSDGIPAVIANEENRIFGCQFHPEVEHTRNGAAVIRGFLFNVCRCLGGWTPANVREEIVRQVREQVGDGTVALGLSGGVDSSVTARLLHEAIGSQLVCVFIDNGFLRAGEAEEVRERFARCLGIELVFIDASRRFFDALKGVVDPEKKRKIIGREFIEVFQNASRRIKGARFLGQGTLYPDVIESVPVHGGPTCVIKSHHNVGGLPEKMDLELVEPLRFMFKDEVRMLGKMLGLPEEVLYRWPFPGPGLAIRVFSQDVTPEKVRMVREADKIFIEEVRRAGLYGKIWQGLVGLAPGKTVGVMGDARTHEYMCVLRAVISADGMTADPFPFHSCFIIAGDRIVREVRGINRVVYDITGKPPGTIEWE